MARTSNSLLLLMLCSFLFFHSACSSSLIMGVVGFQREGRKVGGRMEIKDVKTNKEVQQLGKFSIHEFNSQNRGAGVPLLTFYEVVEAQRQVVSGVKYFLTISAVAASAGSESDEAEMKTFEAVVVVKPWMRYKKLLDFVPSSSDD